MNITPEMKAQFEEQKKQCPYCKIVRGKIQAKTVFEDDAAKAIVEIFPAVKGHIIYLLKEHYPIMPYILSEEFKHFFGLVPQLSKANEGAIATDRHRWSVFD